MRALVFLQHKVSHGTLRVPWLTVSLSAVTIFLYLLGAPVFDFLVFDKQAIMQGQVWRFFTGHFVHHGFDHFFWDLFALFILGMVIEINRRAEVIKSLLLGCSFVSVGLMFGVGGYETYCGLSGALSGSLVTAVFLQYEKTRQKILFLVLLGTLLKFGFELLTHRTLFATSVTGVPAAHLLGFLSGFFWKYTKSFKVRP